MTLHRYIGVKMIQAEPAEKNGQPGYKVVYPDGYESWSPKATFERAYFELTDMDGSKLNSEDIDRFYSGCDVTTLGGHTTVVLVKTITGFDYVTSSPCVDPKNYSEEIGGKLALEKAKNQIWQNLGFVLRWALKGIEV